jgi:hypothetical protein
VCNVIAAGIAIIANIAMTIPAQTPGLGSPWERESDMSGLLICGS